jgi:hypothetical protein
MNRINDKMGCNNLTLGLVIASLAAFISIPLPWGTFTPDSADGEGMAFGQMQITITGISGSVKIAGISLPDWFLCVVSGLASIVFLLNVRRVTNTPAIVAFVPLVIVLLYLIVDIVLLLSNGSVSIGLVLALISTAAVVVLGILVRNFIKNADTQKTGV